MQFLCHIFYNTLSAFIDQWNVITERQQLVFLSTWAHWVFGFFPGSVFVNHHLTFRCCHCNPDVIYHPLTVDTVLFRQKTMEVPHKTGEANSTCNNLKPPANIVLCCENLGFRIEQVNWDFLLFWQELDKMLADTPPVWKGSSNLFRNLRERGKVLTSRTMQKASELKRMVTTANAWNHAYPSPSLNVN